MSENECLYCGAPLNRIYPDAEYELGWAHTSREDARACTGKPGGWPLPAASPAPSVFDPVNQREAQYREETQG